MAAKKTIRSAPALHLENVSVIAKGSEMTQDYSAAIVALAKAVEANANAISSIASNMKPTPGNILHGVHISDVGNSSKV